MTDKDNDNNQSLERIIARKAARKTRSAFDKRHHLWFGFSTFGIIGWSVAIPCLLGTALGLWLDERYPREQSWTLALLLAGLTLGCFNAWRMIERQRLQITAPLKKEDDSHDD